MLRENSKILSLSYQQNNTKICPEQIGIDFFDAKSEGLQGIFTLQRETLNVDTPQIQPIKKIIGRDYIIIFFYGLLHFFASLLLILAFLPRLIDIGFLETKNERYLECVPKVLFMACHQLLFDGEK